MRAPFLLTVILLSPLPAAGEDCRAGRCGKDRDALVTGGAAITLRESEPAAEEQSIAKEPVRFIRHSQKGWVLADPPMYKTLTSCWVLGRRYQCIEEEKRRYSEELAGLEQLLQSKKPE